MDIEGIMYSHTTYYMAFYHINNYGNTKYSFDLKLLKSYLFIML